jgi:hypothetical protein
MDLKEIMCEGMDLNLSGSAQNPMACGVNTVINLTVSKTGRKFLDTGRLLASQEAICSMELVSKDVETD